jgi:nitrogen regulatory protein P-II 1
MSAAHETRLLVAVINDPEKLDEILSGFLELGITGATVLNSEGMGSVLSHDIPIFAGLQTLLHGSRPQNRMIFSVVPLERVDPAVALLREVTGNLDAPATGIVFTLPIDRVEGLAPELGEPGSPI